MKRIIKAVWIMSILLGISGCLQVNTVIKLKPDGSGTIEETALMSKSFIQQMKAMMEAMTAQMEQMMEQTEQKEGQTAHKQKGNEAEKMFDIFDEDKLANKAGNIGEGVTYVSGEKITNDKFEGYKAIYKFTDINKLKINQNPSENIPSGISGKSKESDNKMEFVTFRFTKGTPSTLIIRQPVDKSKSNPVPSSENHETTQTDDLESEMMMEQMKMMFEDMKITMAIDVQGDIVKTNASHREGSKITLMELDFGKLLEMPENLKKFTQTETIEDAKILMKDLPGIKVDLNEEVMVKFK